MNSLQIMLEATKTLQYIGYSDKRIAKGVVAGAECFGNFRSYLLYSSIIYYFLLLLRKAID